MCDSMCDGYVIGKIVLLRYYFPEDKMMSDRKAELERKKAKLQAIREEKERRRREKEQKDVRCTDL